MEQIRCGAKGDDEGHSVDDGDLNVEGGMINLPVMNIQKSMKEDIKIKNKIRVANPIVYIDEENIYSKGVWNIIKTKIIERFLDISLPSFSLKTDEEAAVESIEANKIAVMNSYGNK
jgi:hypothetical protein